MKVDINDLIILIPPITWTAQYQMNLGCVQVFDATNTTPERRQVILSFAKDNGYKVEEESHDLCSLLSLNSSTESDWTFSCSLCRFSLWSRSVMTRKLLLKILK